MLILINDLQVINWTNQHIQICVKTPNNYVLELINVDGSAIELKKFSHYENAFHEMDYLAYTKAVSDKLPFIKLTVPKK